MGREHAVATVAMDPWWRDEALEQLERGEHEGGAARGVGLAITSSWPQPSHRVRAAVRGLSLGEEEPCMWETLKLLEGERPADPLAT